MKKIRWHIGCSGFHYREWKGVFYPTDIPQKEWFEYYSSKFSTLELNVTFYRFPQVKFLQNWYKQSPSSFQFSVKAPRLITHFKKFADCDRLLDDFYTTAESGLKEKLGAVLFQLPPKFQCTNERLDLLVSSMRKGFLNTIEFRDESWWSEEVYQRLKEENIVFSGISHPALPGKAIVTNKIAYYRFHGAPKLYYSAYKDDQLKRVAVELRKNGSLEKAFIYFNNTATTAAIENALWLEKYVNNL